MFQVDLLLLSLSVNRRLYDVYMYMTEYGMGLTRLASGPSVITYPLESKAWMTRGVSKGKLASIEGLKLLNESAVISSVSTVAAGVQPHYMNTYTFMKTHCIRETLNEEVRSTAGGAVPLVMVQRRRTPSSVPDSRLKES